VPVERQPASPRFSAAPRSSRVACGHPVRRALILPAVVLVQTCLGGVYAWSAFVPLLTAGYGLTMGRAQLGFGTAILTCTVAMVAAGHLLRRWGPRGVAGMGALLFASGHQITALSGGRFPWMIAGYGLTAGAGIGFGYVAALTSGMRWFPRRKGAVTGVSVAGFGLGGMLLASLAGHWTRDGWSFAEMFRVIGWGYGIALAVGALLLSRPPDDAADDGTSALVADLRFLKSAGFRVLASGLFCGTFAGLLVIGLLKPIGLAGGLSPAEATRAIGGFVAGNVTGRIVWGWLYDRVGYRTLPAALVILCLGLCGLLVAGHSFAAFLAIGALVGFGFGACFVLYAAHVAMTHGAEQVGRLYPLLFLSYGIAGIAGPPLGGMLHDATGRYSASLILAAFLAALGAWLTRRPPA